MYGVVMHDYMEDYLSSEFVIVYGNTKKEAAANAWDDLKADLGKDIRELEVTKTSFIKDVISNENRSSGLYFPSPCALYIKLFEIPNQIESDDE